MALTTTDWIVIAAYLLLNLVISLYYRRRSSGSTEEFFVSGRNVSWWLAGTSMVATTFSADTPLLVAGLVAKNGISGNWLWWSQCLCGMMTVFFFARYWRRAEILTDVEFVELRYEGKPAAFLRGFRAIYLGALMNCLILGWVIKAMISITTVLLGDAIAAGRVMQIAVAGHVLLHYTLGAPAHTALLICVLILVPFTGIYTFIGGLWGVLVTDLFQFILKMTMIVVLAWIAVSKLGGMTLLKIQLSHVRQLVAPSGQTTGIDPLLLSFLSFRMDHRRPLDSARHYVLSVSRRAVVGQLVSRRGTRRRWLRRPTHVQRERRKKFSRRNVSGSTSRTTPCVPGLGFSPDW